MQEVIRAGDLPANLSNPLLDFAIAGLEAQLKAWQTYQVEGTRFVARRMRGNLEHLRALGHCCDVQSAGNCQRAWLHDLQKDYAEEWGRIAATSFALGLGELSGLGGLLGRHPTKEAAEPRPEAPSTRQASPRVQAAA